MQPKATFEAIWGIGKEFTVNVCVILSIQPNVVEVPNNVMLYVIFVYK